MRTLLRVSIPVEAGNAAGFGLPTASSDRRWCCARLSVVILAILSIFSASGASQSKGGTVGASLRGHPRNGNPKTPEITSRRLWSGSEIFGSISPDGRHIAYYEYATGNVGVRNLISGEDRFLTHRTGHAGLLDWVDDSLIWSPDGTQIVYNWDNLDGSTDLRVIGLDGNGPSVLYTNREVTYCPPFGWSPDGKSIFAMISKSDGTSQIAAISVTDRSLSTLKNFGSSSPEAIKLSPNGAYVAYEVSPQKESNQHDIFLVSTDGKRDFPVIKGPGDDHLIDWTPDGKGLVFKNHRAGTKDVWVMPVENGEPQGSPVPVQRDLDVGEPVGLTGLGSLYFVRDASVSDVYVVDADPKTGRVVSPPTKLALHHSGHNYLPMWSPDGSKLTYLSRSYPISLSTFDIEAGENRELPVGISLYTCGYGWSPDGGFVVVAGTSSDGREGVFRIEVNTGRSAPVFLRQPGTPFLTDPDPIWSRDGKAIFFHSLVGEQAIRVYDIATHAERVLYKPSWNSSLYRTLALSPDGRSLAFLLRDNPNDSVAVCVMPTSGGPPRKLYREADGRVIQDAFSVAWSHDGSHILFAQRPSAQAQDELWRIPIEGGEPERLGLRMNEVRDVQVSPDGKHIAFSAGLHLQSELWVIDNFLSAIEEGVRLPTPTKP